MHLLSQRLTRSETHRKGSVAVFIKIGPKGQIGSCLISKLGSKQYLSIEDGKLRLGLSEIENQRQQRPSPPHPLHPQGCTSVISLTTSSPKQISPYPSLHDFELAIILSMYKDPRTEQLQTENRQLQEALRRLKEDQAAHKGESEQP